MIGIFLMKTYVHEYDKLYFSIFHHYTPPVDIRADLHALSKITKHGNAAWRLLITIITLQLLTPAFVNFTGSQNDQTNETGNWRDIDFQISHFVHNLYRQEGRKIREKWTMLPPQTEAFFLLLFSLKFIFAFMDGKSTSEFSISHQF